MSPEHSKAETVKLRITLKGDFSDAKDLPFEYYYQPLLLWSVPFIGRKNGGTIVQVFGENFRNYSETLKCSFGTIYVNATYVSPNQITCV